MSERSDYLTVGAAARQIGALPADISQMFYRRVLDDEACPVVRGRRMIPPEYVDVIRSALARYGKIKLGVARPGDINT